MGVDPFSNVNIPESDANSIYGRLESGENRIRILGPVHEGYVLWQDGKPTRSKTPIAGDGDDKPKYFCLIPVWMEDEVKFLDLTQKTILTVIQQLNDSEEWGVTTEYDIIINKQGESLDTTYSVTPCKPAKLDKEAKKAWKEVKGRIDFDGYIEGGNILTSDDDDDGLPF